MFMFPLKNLGRKGSMATKKMSRIGLIYSLLKEAHQIEGIILFTQIIILYQYFIQACDKQITTKL